MKRETKDMDVGGKKKIQRQAGLFKYRSTCQAEERKKQIGIEEMKYR
jgi:hypothetical protein